MSKAILIIDVQKGFINQFASHIPPLVERLQLEYEYIFITQFINEKDSHFRKLIDWNRFDENSEDVALAFNPLETAIIIKKNKYSCVDYDFINKLKKLNITTMDIVGIDTDICVTKCAVDLFENNIIPRVLIPFCASHAGIDSHNNAIKNLERFIGKKQVINNSNL